MRFAQYILIVAFLALPAAPALAQDDNNCLLCHQSFEGDDGPSHRFSRDIHFQHSILCHECHGGDPALDDMDEVRESDNWRGVPSHGEVPNFCARCHSDPSYMHEHNPGLPTDQLAKYKTSVHGQLLLEEGDSNVANCVSCHSSHQIGTAKMPHSSTHPQNIPDMCGSCHANEDHMSGYGIPTDQVSDYKQSVHGEALLVDGDLAAPACNDCHGNHGASPPGVGSLSAVCGTCHAFQMDLFNKSPHGAAFADYGFPMCEACHGNHKITSPTDDWVGTADPAVCTECHSEDDGTRAFQVAAGISHTLDSLVSQRTLARQKLAKASDLGMMTSELEFTLKDVTQNLIETRTMVHSFSLEKVQEEANDGFAKAEEVRQQAAGLIDEYYFRRKGLGLATLFITILAVTLWLKIRRLD